MHLIDTWRFMHPEGRDFTFYSVPHARYSRIDYIFISSKDLHTVTETNISIQSISDHAPVSLSLDSNISSTKAPNWRLNSSLLTDHVFLPKITSHLKEFFIHNETQGMDPLMLCQGGVDGAQRKREREKEITKLTDKIFELGIPT